MDEYAYKMRSLHFVHNFSPGFRNDTRIALEEGFHLSGENAWGRNVGAVGGNILAIVLHGYLERTPCAPKYPRIAPIVAALVCHLCRVIDCVPVRLPAPRVHPTPRTGQCGRVYTCLCWGEHAGDGCTLQSGRTPCAPKYPRIAPHEHSGQALARDTQVGAPPKNILLGYDST